VTGPSTPEEPPASERTFLGASRPPKAPSKMTEAELDVYVDNVMRDMVERYEQIKTDDSTGADA
jgi:hypothetical protein